MIEAMDGFYICILQKTTAFAMLLGRMRKETEWRDPKGVRVQQVPRMEVISRTPAIDVE